MNRNLFNRYMPGKSFNPRSFANGTWRGLQVGNDSFAKFRACAFSHFAKHMINAYPSEAPSLGVRIPFFCGGSIHEKLELRGGQEVKRGKWIDPLFAEKGLEKGKGRAGCMFSP